MHCFSFDIETIPDVEFGRRMWGLEGLPDDEVATAMTFMRQQQTGSDFLPLHQHRVVAISVALRTGDSFKVWSLGDEESEEAEIVGRFFDGIERYAPDLSAKMIDSEILTPFDIERQFGMTGGHWHHGELSLDQMLMLRPVPGAAQYATPLAGLYLCGAGCHPGGGVMGAAGLNAARQVMQREAAA